jgi:hypothetical protein
VPERAVLAKPLTDAHGGMIIVRTVPRLFTPEEANDALTLIRPIAERMVGHAAALAAAQARQRELALQIGANGGDLSPGEVRDAAGDVQRELDAVAECVASLDTEGVQVKDVAEGLLDFPARHGGRDVLLCWRVGEPEVAYWHGLEEGFAGRKRLPFADEGATG